MKRWCASPANSTCEKRGCQSGTGRVQAGNTIEKYEYSVYGEVNIVAKQNGETRPASIIGNPYYFTGRRLDTETGLYYYRARYYSPALGRFLQTDPIGYADGIDWYAYCGNNPVVLVDPWGLCRDSVGAPGFLESLIPVWGSGRSAINDFQQGNYFWGAVNTVFAISDVAMVKAAATKGIGKVGARLIGGVALASSADDIIAKGGVKAYQVGTHNSLQKLSNVGDDLVLHHVGQFHAMKQVVPGFTYSGGATIALPTVEHFAISNITGVYDDSARALLSRNIRDLRIHVSFSHFNINDRRY